METDNTNQIPTSVNSNNAPVNTSQENPGSSPRSLVRNKIVLVIIILIVMLTAGGIIWLQTGQKKPTEPTPISSERNIVLATIGTTKITKEYVRNIALESYIPSAINNTVIKQQLDVAVERVILEKEALRKNIVIPNNLSKQEYYSLLKVKVTEGQILSVEEHDISWWIPPAPEYEQRPEFIEQRSIQATMAAEIEGRIIIGEDPLVVARDMTVKYKIFENILGYNGQIVKQINPTVTSEPRIVQYDPTEATKPFFSLLYSMNSNEVRTGIWPNGSGGAVIKTLAVTSGVKIDYKRWLTQQINTLVKYNYAEISKL